MCNTILSLDINSTPLSKVLSILDILITNIHEWEQYASRSINSLFEEQNLIMKLIRYYRFVEIQSWKNFLASKEKTLIEEEVFTKLGKKSKKEPKFVEAEEYYKNLKNKNKKKKIK